MKNILLVLLLFSAAGSAFSYTAGLSLTVTPRELKIQANYVFEKNSIKLVLPKRARLISVASSSQGGVNPYLNGNILFVDNVVSNFQGRINIIYSFSLNDINFYNDDWLIHPDEKGSINAGITLPEGCKGLIIPYVSKDQDGFTVSEDDKPLLICGKFKSENYSGDDRNYEIYYQNKIFITTKDIDNVFKSYENLLFPLEQKNITVIMFPSIPGTIRYKQNNIFLVINNTSSDELKKSAAQVWFKGLLKYEGNELFAYSDIYKRLIQDNGRPTTDAAYIVAVPSRSYYEETLQKGFTTGGVLSCDINNMMKNFAILHFAYYTAGIDNFINASRAFFLQKKDAPESNNMKFADSFASISNANPDLAIIAGKYLPFSQSIPDLSVRGKIAFRNLDSVPDIDALVNGEKKKILWNNKRSQDAAPTNSAVILDPDRLIPQLNFYNDISIADVREADELKAAEQAAVQHRHYGGESTREILYLEKYKTPAVNGFSIPPDSSVYIAVVKFFAPVNDKFATGLKELIIAVKNGRAFVVADRIRL